MMKNRMSAPLWLGAFAALLLAIPAWGVDPSNLRGPSFIPDGTLTGSSLAGWHTLGPAQWHLDNGVLTGTPGPGGAGGWLVLDSSYQDVGLYTKFDCSGGCETGILFRIEKTPDGGMKGDYAMLSGGDAVTYYAVTTDAEGKIITRTPLPPGGGQMRIAPPPRPAQERRAPHPENPFDPNNPTPGLSYPFLPPDSNLAADQWNDVELQFDANILRAAQNNGLKSGGVTDSNGYGPFAFYVGGSGKVEYKQVAYKDLMLHIRDRNYTSPVFEKQTLNNFYYAWGAAAADFDRDGTTDVVSGPFIYYGPDYTRSREIYLAQTANPSTEYANSDWMEFAGDFEGNGWPDVLICNPFGPTVGCYLYTNARGEHRRWDVHRVIDHFNSEIGVVTTLNGRPALVYSGEDYVRYAQPDPSNPTGPWTVHNISIRGYGTAHGIGVGDINGDGRLDIINPYGWWEQPPAGQSAGTWKYHPVAFGRYDRGNIMGGSVMAVYDVNGDGRNDVVTVLDPHGWGLAWFEQKRDSQGNITFVRHMVMDTLWTKNAGGVTFTEAHGDTYGDVDGDGIPDFIVGKRYWSHRDDYHDPDPYGTPVLYWYQTVRDPKAPGGARFVPHLVDNRSGAGSDILAADLKHDGKLDIVTATRFGTFIFWNRLTREKTEPGRSTAAR